MRLRAPTAAVRGRGGTARRRTIAAAEAAGFWDIAARPNARFLRCRAIAAAVAPVAAADGAPPLGLGRQLIEWGGGAALAHAPTPPRARRCASAAAAVGGHATLFRGRQAGPQVFSAAAAGLLAIHDGSSARSTRGILNPGRLYPAYRTAQRCTAASSVHADAAPRRRIRDTAGRHEADAILRKCVHCGFCTATCPTYQLLGDELDGPRGRIYLIKQVLEGDAAAALDPAAPRPLPHVPQLRDHLPVGRAVRAAWSRSAARSSTSGSTPARRPVVRARCCGKAGFAGVRAVRPLGRRRALRPLLPEYARSRKVPPRRAPRHAMPTARHPRKVLVLVGCVQPAMMPNIDTRHRARARRRRHRDA